MFICIADYFSKVFFFIGLFFQTQIWEVSHKKIDLNPSLLKAFHQFRIFVFGPKIKSKNVEFPTLSL